MTPRSHRTRPPLTRLAVPAADPAVGYGDADAAFATMASCCHSGSRKRAMKGAIESSRLSLLLREKVASAASRMVKRASALGRRKRHAPHPPAVQERGFRSACR